MAEKERNDDNTGKSEGKPGHGKRILLRTFGCQMNESDSELVRSILKDNGYRFVDSPDKADVILLNTCSVRETATRKVTGHIFEMRHRLGKAPLIGILGCMAAEAQQKLLHDKKLGIALVAGPDSYQKLPQLIREARNKSKPFDINLTGRENYKKVYPARMPGVNAWVTIMRGCDNFCSYCIVPYVRGRERSRAPQDVILEVERLVAEGYPQVTLLGQNVNSYRRNGYDFPKLLDQISRTKGLERIRFMSPHPKDFSSTLIRLIAARPNICKHIHLPLQSGSTRILKLMNRKYTKTQYLSLVRKIQRSCPGIAITTDIIVGFPSETKKDFAETLGVLKAVRFDSAFIFKYSPRSGTAAQRRLVDDVTAEEKTRRIVLLNETQIKISLDQNKKLVGQTEEILIDEQKTPNIFRGRTDTNKLVSFEAKRYRIGQSVNVRIEDASVNGLSGKVIE